MLDLIPGCIAPHPYNVVTILERHRLPLAIPPFPECTLHRDYYQSLAGFWIRIALQFLPKGRQTEPSDGTSMPVSWWIIFLTTGILTCINVQFTAL